MGRIKKIARRTFLVSSTAVLGGVAFGVYKLQQQPKNPLIAAYEKATLNPFIVIDQNGVIFVVPKAEMGQGIHTAWAALIAEELDVNIENIKVIHGPPAKAYYNSILMGLALPFRDYEMTNFKHGLRKFIGRSAKLINLQLTGGSTSVKDGFDRMRIAGATARETLKIAASRLWGIPTDQLKTSDGQVFTTDGRQIEYQDLANAASQITPPKVLLRKPSQWRYLGKTIPRVDIPQKVDGSAEFGSDIKIKGLLFATVRMSPKRAGMKSFDASTAQKMLGVVKIIDLDEGIAVVATNTWLAMQAAEEIKIKWEDAPYPANSEAMFKAFDAALDSEPDAVMRNDGDSNQDHQGKSINVEYKVPWLAHSCMEPMTATAHYKDGNLIIWSGNQLPNSTRKNCAEAVGLEAEKVTVHTTYMGGSFGRRSKTDFSVLAARIAVNMPETPIRLSWDRKEDMCRDFYRTAAMARFKGIITGQKCVAINGKVAAISGTTGGPGKHLAGAHDQPYDIANYRMSGHAVNLKVPTGHWRSVDHSFNCFFLESFIDEMAAETASDPILFRLNLLSEKDRYSVKVLEAVAEMSNWGSSKSSASAKGVAFSYSFGTPVATICEVTKKNGAIQLTKVWLACDVGTALDPGNIEAQMVGGTIYGLSAALYGEISFNDGEVQQFNFPDYEALRMANSPNFTVKVLENKPYIGGVGEIATPPAAPALVNAIYALTKKRARTLPLHDQFKIWSL